MSTMQNAADYAEARDDAAKATAEADAAKTRGAYRDGATAQARAALAADVAGLSLKTQMGHSGECRRLSAAADALSRPRARLAR